jgi:hypothetical protein
MLSGNRQVRCAQAPNISDHVCLTVDWDSAWRMAAQCLSNLPLSSWPSALLAFWNFCRCCHAGWHNHPWHAATRRVSIGDGAGREKGEDVKHADEAHLILQHPGDNCYQRVCAKLLPAVAPVAVIPFRCTQAVPCMTKAVLVVQTWV